MRMDRVLILLFVFGAIGLSFGVTHKSTEKSFTSNNEVIAKRDLKVDDAASKSFDVQPEYYRGPGSSLERDKDSTVIGLNRPFSAAGHGSYENRYPPKGGSSIMGSDRDNIRDRLNAGHFSPSSSPTASSFGNDYSGNGYSYSSSGYPGGPGTGPGGAGANGGYQPMGGNIPYGQPQPIDFSSPGKNILSALGLQGKYKPYGQYEPGYSTGLDWSQKGYGDYGHSSYPSSYTPSEFYYPDKSDLKSVILPLAGIALLGIAAAVIANPMLLHLGTMTGRKKKRDIQEQAASGRDMPEHRNDANDLAYRAYKKN